MAELPSTGAGPSCGPKALVHGRDRGRLRGGADVVREGVQVAVGGEDADAFDLAALVVVLDEGGLAGGEGAAGADDVGADDRRARPGRGQVVRGDRERVAVRQGVREGAAEHGEEVPAVDGVDDRPAGREVDVVDARARRVTAVSRSNSLSPIVARTAAGAEAASGMTEPYNRKLLSGSFGVAGI